MERCDVCGNRYAHAFRVILADGSDGVFDCLECAIERIAPRCRHCGCRVIGHGVESAGVIFCCNHCVRASSSDAVDAASMDSFPASDPPAHPPSAIDAPRRFARMVREQDGRVGWVVLWLLGVPIPVLLVLFLLRGCT